MSLDPNVGGGGGGACRPSPHSGDRVPPLYKPPPSFPPHLSPKIPLKNQEKKRGTSTKNPKKEIGEEKESGETLPDYALVICR